MSHNRMDREARKHREDLTGEHRLGDAGQLLLFLTFLAVWITDSFFFKYSIFLNNYIPLTVQIPLGVIILIGAALLAKTSLTIVFGKVREDPSVIRKGVFGIIRHPIYMSEILLYLGLLFLSTSLAAIGVWIVVIAFLHYISRHEEKLLLERFGDEYRQYMKDVPMYIPRLHRRKIKSRLKIPP